MDLLNSLDRQSAWLALFASTGTLICCALPIMLISIGLGAVVASTIFQFPFLVTLSDHPILMFGGSFVLLAVAGWFAFIRPFQCPAEPVLAAKCQQAKIWNQRIWWSSVVLWLVGFFASFLFPVFSRL